MTKRNIIRITRSMLMLAGSMSVVASSQFSDALAQNPAGQRVQPAAQRLYAIPAQCTDDGKSVQEFIRGHKLVIRERPTRHEGGSDARHEGGIEIFNTDPGVNPGDITPSAKTAVPNGLYSFVVTNPHTIVELATIDRTGKLVNVQTVPIHPNGRVYYWVGLRPSDPAREYVAVTGSFVISPPESISSSDADVEDILFWPILNNESKSLANNPAVLNSLQENPERWPAVQASLVSQGTAVAKTTGGKAPSGAIRIGIDATHRDVNSKHTGFSWCEVYSKYDKSDE